MKLKKLLITAATIGAATLSMAQQAPTGLGQSGVGANSGTYWARGGNNNFVTTNNIFGTLWNSPIWITANNAFRMAVFGGGTTQVDGRVAFSNNLPATFTPRDRVHLFEAAATGSVQVRFQNTATGTAATDGYAIGTDNASRIVNHTQFENRSMRWLSPDARNLGNITEWMRIENNRINVHTSNTPTDGYIGLNNARPYFHIDGITPSFPGGELFLSFQNTDAGDTRMGLVNAAQVNNVMQPTFFGNLDSTQRFTALQTVGSVKGNQDTTPNTQAITRFISGRDWTFNIQGIQNVNEVTFRNLFSWHNGNIIMMQMTAQGRLRIGRNLTTLGAAPRNRVEISANPIDPYGNKIATNGASGLRLTYLTSAKTPVPKDTNGVDITKALSVDSAGNVVLINVAPSGTGLGNLCADTAKKPLTGDYEIPMAGFNFNYTTPANTQASFHVGNTVCLPTLGRMNVYNDNLAVSSVVISNVNLATNSIGLFSNTSNTGSGNALSVQGTANSSSAGSTARGVRGEAVATNGVLAEGVKGIATTNNNCQQNIAVGGLAANGTAISIAGDFDVENSNSGFNQGINVEVKLGNNPASTNSGITTQVTNPGATNYGGFFTASGATQNIGVYGSAGGSSTGTTPSPTQPNLAGFFNGDVYISGSFGPSDQNLKENVDTITNAMNIINQLKPKSFDYKHASYPSMHLPVGKQFGLIAQEVEAIIPELVTNNTQPATLDSIGNELIPAVNFKGLEYQQLIPFLIKGMQEQQAKIDSLIAKLNAKDSIQDARLTALENAIAACCSNASTRSANSSLNQLDVELSDKDAIVLNQNVPNPFAEQTTITYNVPASVGKAQIIFFNNLGQVIQTVDIKTRGKGKVNVFASDLSSGLYNYTLVADGKVIDSKKMVRE